MVPKNRSFVLQLVCLLTIAGVVVVSLLFLRGQSEGASWHHLYPNQQQQVPQQLHHHHDDPLTWAEMQDAPLLVLHQREAVAAPKALPTMEQQEAQSNPSSEDNPLTSNNVNVKKKKNLRFVGIYRPPVEQQ